MHETIFRYKIRSGILSEVSLFKLVIRYKLVVVQEHSDCLKGREASRYEGRTLDLRERIMQCLSGEDIAKRDNKINVVILIVTIFLFLIECTQLIHLAYRIKREVEEIRHCFT